MPIVGLNAVTISFGVTHPVVGVEVSAIKTSLLTRRFSTDELPDILGVYFCPFRSIPI